MAPRACFVTVAASLASVACGASEPGEVPPPVCGLLPGAEIAHRSQCGPTLDFTPINQYAGSIASVQDREDAVVLINGSCTGTLIEASAGPVVLTAGHCVGLGDRSLLAFNFEVDADGDPLVTNGTVIEKSSEPDYALIELDVLPMAVSTPLTTRVSARLAVIQHPRSARKVIAEGDFLETCEPLFIYGDLDTLVGSSGAGVLTSAGYLFGVHTDGDCDRDGNGANTGWTASGIVAASAYLQPADIADR